MVTNDENPGDRFYDGVLKRVLWGEDREDVLRTLEVNGISPGDAARVYERAVSERIAAIRGIYVKRIVMGFVLIVVGCGALWGVYGLTEGFTVWSAKAIVIPAAPVAFGAWKLLNGLVGFLTAAGRSGSVSDID